MKPLDHRKLRRLAPTAEAASVGIFWVYGQRLFAFTEDAAGLPAIRGYVTSTFEHVSIWPQVQARHSQLQNRTYESVARGRVTRLPTGKFLVLVPTALLRNERLLRRIAKVFMLPSGQYDVVRDEHYDPPETVEFGD